MQEVQIKDQTIPALGFGTWELTGEQCAKSVAFALEEGFTHVDTAQIYGNEAEVGEGISSSSIDRDNIFLTTKVWRDQFENKTVMQSVEESLKKLQTEYVDLLLIHWPFPETPVADMVEAMMKVKETGKTRLIGVSNFTVTQMKEAMDVSGGSIACNQVEYHPYLDQSAVYDFARKNDIVMTAYSPIARGKVVSDTTLKEIGMKHGKTPVQVTLRWLLQQEGIVAIPKSGTEKNIKANLDIFNFELSEDEMNSIFALVNPNGRLVDPDFAPEWDKAA